MSRKKKTWQHESGGTLCQSKSRYPCDDVFACKSKRVYFRCTINAHFSMPFEVNRLSELTKLKGVRLVRTEVRPTYRS